jgi:hypothetical protein
MKTVKCHTTVEGQRLEASFSISTTWDDVLRRYGTEWIVEAVAEKELREKKARWRADAVAGAAAGRFADMHLDDQQTFMEGLFKDAGVREKLRRFLGE